MVELVLNYCYVAGGVSMRDQALFSEYEVFSVIEARKQTIKNKMQEIDPNTLLAASEQDVIRALIEDLRLSVPTVSEEKIYIAWESVRPTGVPLRSACIAGVGFRAGMPSSWTLSRLRQLLPWRSD